MAEVPADHDWLSPWEQDLQARMRFPKRRTEFRLGRWTAKHALAAQAGDDPTPERLAAIEVRRAPDGAPWPHHKGEPAPVAMSMTDRADWAVCVVGAAGVDLGVDLELVEPRSSGFVRDFLTAVEQVTVATAGDPDEHALLANLMWSAKESALKVLRTGLRRSTHSVEVRVEEPQSGWGATAGWQPLAVHTAEGAVFPGWWIRYGPFVLTTAASEALEPPVPQVEPPGLATAVPGHSWLDASVGPSSCDPAARSRSGAADASP